MDVRFAFSPWGGLDSGAPWLVRLAWCCVATWCAGALGSRLLVVLVELGQVADIDARLGESFDLPDTSSAGLLGSWPSVIVTGPSPGCWLLDRRLVVAWDDSNILLEGVVGPATRWEKLGYAATSVLVSVTVRVLVFPRCWARTDEDGPSRDCLDVAASGGGSRQLLPSSAWSRHIWIQSPTCFLKSSSKPLSE